jgi:hypothetical protein
LLAGVYRVVRAGAMLALPIVFVAAIALVRSGGADAASLRVTGPTVEVPPDASARSRLSAAATAIGTALAKGGGGITFEVVQTQTLNAKPGGPKLEIHDPADRTKVLGLTDTLPVSILVERGVATPAGFWSELIHGPMPGAEASFDLAKAEPARQALVRDGVRYRNDGDGWTETDVVPGIGLDPDSVLKLASLLTDTTDAADRSLAAESDPAFNLRGLRGPAQAAARAIDATSKVANLPAILAPDLAGATELRGRTDFELDAAGRLVSLTVVARNGHMDEYDLMVKTVITFRYPDAPPPLPDPLPAYVAPAPESDGE